MNRKRDLHQEQPEKLALPLTYLQIRLAAVSLIGEGGTPMTHESATFS